MHTLHCIATTATSKGDAYNKVRNAIDAEDGIAPWSDWSEVGGGRWANSDDPLDGVLSYDNSPEEFIAEVKRIHSNRCAELKSSLERSNWRVAIEDQVERFTKEIIFPEPFIIEKSPIDMELYYLDKAVGLLYGRYHNSSYFYDLDDWTSDLYFLLERLNNGEKNQFLVRVDFHH